MARWEAKDKTFLITGGASGLGAEYAETFLNEGAKMARFMAQNFAISGTAVSLISEVEINTMVSDGIRNKKVAILDIAEEIGKATAERLNKVHGNKAVFIKCDVSKEDDITSAFDSVLAQFKQIDVIINNAGVMVDAPHMWRTASDVNWQGLVSLTLKGVKHMRKDEGGVGGTIFNVASTVALSKLPALPIYSGSKMAVLHFSQCLAMDPFYDTTGIRVLTLCLGATDTPLLHNLELRSYDPKMGKIMADMFVADGVVYQKPASAVAAVLQMFKTGAPASIWLSVDNEPARNITPVIDGAFKDFENLLLP